MTKLPELSLDQPAQTSAPQEANNKPPKDKSKSKPKRSLVFRIFKWLCILGLAGAILGACTLYALFTWASQDLPNFSKIADYRPPLTTTILARDGSVIGLLYREKRYMLSQDQMSPYLLKAFVAAEDDKFYTHYGIDPMGIFRAAIMNFKSGTIKQGGSTITQQIVKRLMLTPEKSYERKLKEVILALRLENYMSKDEILNIYLNQIYLGGSSYGVEAAARSYFNKHASALTIAESALIAGLVQSPSRYNPFRNPDAARTRQVYVLQRMRALGMISDSEYEEAYYQELKYESMSEGMGRVGLWYLEEVRRQLVEMFSEANIHKFGLNIDKYGEDAVYELGLTVHTAMDPYQQLAADQSLRMGLEDATRRNGWLGALENIPSSEIDEYLAKQNFKPSDLLDGKWVKALVSEVTQDKVKVKLGQYQGEITLKNMSWAREPNLSVAAANAPAIKDATKVVTIGDLIWVALAPLPPAAKGKADPEPYNPNLITPYSLINLVLRQYPDIQSALVSIENKTGDVVALIGGYNFYDSQYNRVTQAKRQPGSSFKPIVYSAALDYGYTTGTTVLDAPFVFVNEYTEQVWRPSNYEKNFQGAMPLTTALAKSRNLCTVRIAYDIGIPAIIERAQALELDGNFPNEFAVSLGAVAVSPLSLTRAYTAFGNEGKLVTPRFISSIEGAWGNILYSQEPEAKQVISPENAYLMSNMLQNVVKTGTASRANVLGRPVGGKTGTSNDEYDAWFVGITPNITTGIWVGYDQLQSLGRLESGGRTALPIFVEYAKKAYELYPPDEFVKPDSIIFETVNGLSLPFITGTVPMETTNPQSQKDLLKSLF